MDIQAYDASDIVAVTEVVELHNAASKIDSPWEHPETVKSLTGTILHGWDGETPRCFLGRASGRAVADGMLWLSEWDNRHLAWARLSVHPDERRAGHGTELFGFLVEQARALGRTSIGSDGWDSPRAHAFAANQGLVARSVAVQRRLHLEDLDRETVQQLYAEARSAASSYDLLRISGRTPEDMMGAVAEMTAAINDAPTDDLDIEDEVFPRERVEAYETATLAKDARLYRIVARHKESGELAGHTVVAVEAERPSIGHQHDTSVVRTHRGHRLGVLLKTDMLRWLAEEEPQLRSVDTWNAASNDHMVGINERLGYRVLGREVQFQRDI